MLQQRADFSTPLQVGLSGFLLSPGCSIFAYSPLLLLLPRTLPGFWRAHRAECVTILAICLSFLIFCARFDLWTGLWSAPGPRLVFVTLPLLMLPLGLWLDSPPRRWERATLLGLAAMGLTIQLFLMATRWSAVIRGMKYLAWGPDHGFVFVAQQSPIFGSVRFALQGDVDAWLWGLALGFDGRAASPGAAALLLLAWAAALGWALLRLRGRAAADAR